jgi:hypothetical protein
MSAICSHTDSITVTELPDEIAGCADCLAIGGTWVREGNSRLRVFWLRLV